MLDLERWRARGRDLAEFIFPQRCVVCGRFGDAIHAPCVDALPLADGPRCRTCWAPARSVTCPACAADDRRDGFDALRARFRFAEAARRALLEAKFRGITALLPPLARAASEAVERDWWLDVVVPIPLSSARQRRRGYNQAAIVAETVATALDLPHHPAALARTRNTAAQARLTAEARATNLAGAFAAREPAAIRGARVLLVDDITTTGATLNEAARTLRLAGASAVFALAVARED